MKVPIFLWRVMPWGPLSSALSPVALVWAFKGWTGPWGVAPVASSLSSACMDTSLVPQWCVLMGRNTEFPSGSFTHSWDSYHPVPAVCCRGLGTLQAPQIEQERMFLPLEAYILVRRQTIMRKVSRKVWVLGGNEGLLKGWGAWVSSSMAVGGVICLNVTICPSWLVTSRLALPVSGPPLDRVLPTLSRNQCLRVACH